MLPKATQSESSSLKASRCHTEKYFDLPCHCYGWVLITCGVVTVGSSSSLRAGPRRFMSAPTAHICIACIRNILVAVVGAWFVWRGRASPGSPPRIRIAGLRGIERRSWTPTATGETRVPVICSACTPNKAKSQFRNGRWPEDRMCSALECGCWRQDTAVNDQSRHKRDLYRASRGATYLRQITSQRFPPECENRT